jgi:Chaperone of endosialidase
MAATGVPSSSAGWGLTGNSGTTAGTNFIGTTDAQALVFKTNGTEGMRLSTGQNLSIGAATPLSTARLHVENTGSNYAYYAPIATNLNYFAGNTAFGGYSSNPNDISLLWGAAAVDNAISLQKDFTSFTGTTLYRGLSTVLRLSPSANVSNTIHGLTNDIQTNAAATANFSSLIRAVGADFRHYGTGIVSNIEGLNAHVGNYGTGTITDAYGVYSQIFKSSGTIINSYGGRFISTGGSTTNYGIHAGTDNTATNNYLYYGASVAGANTNWGIYLTGEDKSYFSGSVGIGATSPPERLVVQSETANDLDDDIAIRTYSASTTPALVYFKARGTAAVPLSLGNNELSGGFNCQVYNGSGFINATAINAITASDFTTSGGSDLFFSTQRSGSISERMRINSLGRVGIGTTAPDQLLSVNGNASKAGGGSWAAFSDSRVKRNVRQFTDGLATLQKINPVWFQYNNKSGYTDTIKTYVGVIAQDVEKVAPYMVEKTKTANFDDQRVYDSNALNYILVNSVKELAAKNEKVELENASLKSEIESLKAALKKQGTMTETFISRLEKLEANRAEKPKK